jgi:predicted O-linked N-acetylglucosamine transferase (SPINDLY family)
MPPLTVTQTFSLAVSYHHAGRLTEAETLYRQIVTAEPLHAEAWHNLGICSQQMSHYDEAVLWIRRAIEIAPQNAVAHYSLGNTLRDMGNLAEAIAAYQRALELDGQSAPAYNNLGVAFTLQGRYEEAMAALRRALELRPDSAVTENNLATVMNRCDRFEEAIAACHRALELQPDYADAYNTLGNALREVGAAEEAAEAYRKGCSLSPPEAPVHSSLLFTLHQIPGLSRQAIAEEHRRWSRRLLEQAGKFRQPFLNERNPNRPLRIGYVSPDFRDQVVGRNLVPLFRFHDRAAFEIFCYSDAMETDALTNVFRGQTHHWRNATGSADVALAEMIREDRIDVLVDLAQHVTGNRLAVFARNPAPVQVSFAGYPESAGLEAIPYRISDRWLESEIDLTAAEISSNAGPDFRASISELPSVERIFRIESFWCYDPCGANVPIKEVPARAKGRVTFGCFANTWKFNKDVLRLWSRVLAESPEARLVLRAPSTNRREAIGEFLKQNGVAADRLEFVARYPRNEYLERYNRLDIALDPFPYGGHTTSLDALWMGVPVVSLAGERPVSRAGLSILNNLGLPELVTFSEDEYVQIAVNLANDLPRLAELRRTLRSRMEASVLMDAPHFARQIEAAYRAMWREWCARQESL